MALAFEPIGFSTSEVIAMNVTSIKNAASSFVSKTAEQAREVVKDTSMLKAGAAIAVVGTVALGAQAVATAALSDLGHTILDWF